MKFPWDQKVFEKIAYPDGSSYVMVDFTQPSLEFRINSYEDLWTLTQIKDVYDHNKMPVDLTIPCLLDAQADRRFGQNESSNLKLILKHLARLNFRSISIFHPHNPEVVEALLDRVNIIDNHYFIESVIKKLYRENTYCIGTPYYKQDLCDNLILMSTDAGGFKPLMKLANKLSWRGEVASASKSREYKDGETILTQMVVHSDFRGKDVLIIDDLCVKGGTFIGLAKILKERNVGKIYLATSHMTVPDFNPQLTEVYDRIFTTNSKGLTYPSKSIEILNYRKQNE